jgi:hypothetical protein
MCAIDIFYIPTAQQRTINLVDLHAGLAAGEDIDMILGVYSNTWHLGPFEVVRFVWPRWIDNVVERRAAPLICGELRPRMT